MCMLPAAWPNTQIQSQIERSSIIIFLSTAGGAHKSSSRAHAGQMEKSIPKLRNMRSGLPESIRLAARPKLLFRFR